MKINELSKMTGLSKQTIRYYESIGLLSPKRNTNNYREYSETDFKDIEFILKLKALPMALNDIGLLLELKNKENSLKCKKETILFVEKYQKIVEEKIKVFSKTKKLLIDIKELIYNDTFINQEKQIVALLQQFEEEI
ncbi:MAG: MerR family transcriptional regulator [Streptococcaceae bacterium]|jgi:MerR family Zn(II)-responsive transcriptional regulator of zntA|nr:MerR family transcriptional regulator [Streptococcaceae bacterium]MCH4176763.1 MerR family transcriptional regulator [Streptococcaceae bacterium]